MSGSSGARLAAALLLALAVGAQALHAHESRSEECGLGYRFDAAANKCKLKWCMVNPMAYTSHAQGVSVALLAMKHVNERDGVVVGEETANAVSLLDIELDVALNPTYSVQGAINAFNDNLPMAGLLGEIKSSNSIPLAYHAAGRGVPQMSYISTSPTLSASSTFPYFMRPVPGDDLAVYAGSSLLASYGWNSVAMVYVNDGYGYGYLNGMRTYETESGVNVRLAVPIDDGSSDEVLRSALENIKARNLYIIYVALFNDQHRFLELAEEMGMVGKGYQYVYSDSSATLSAVTEHYKNATKTEKALKRLDGALVVRANGMAEAPQVDALHKAYSAFMAEIAEENPSDPHVARAKEQLIAMGALTKYTFEEQATGDVELPKSLGFMYDMVWLLALSQQKVLEKHPDVFGKEAFGIEWASNVTAMLTDATAPIVLPNGVSGGPVRLATNGDRDESTVAIKVYNWQDGQLVEAQGVVKGLNGEPATVSTIRPVRFGGNASEPPLDGWSCSSGYTYSIQGGCTPCPMGTFLNETTQLCERCPKGAFSSKEASTACETCKGLPDATMRYQDEEGATTCKPCPDNTVRPGNQPGESIEECLCMENFYQPDRKRNGAPCIPCEIGGVCPGANQAALNNTLAYPKPGYWGEPGYQHLFIPCPLKKATRQCSGGPSFECVEGYEGTLCSMCSKDHFHASGACYKCEKDPGGLAVFFTFVTFMIFFSWFAVNKLTAGRYDAADIFLHFMQLSDIIGNFSVDYDDNIETWKVASGFVNFDVDIISMWECYIPWSYLGSFLLICMLSWMKLAIAMTSYGFNHLVLRLASTRHARVFVTQYIALGFEVRSADELRIQYDEMVEEFCNMYIITYNALCARCFYVFMGSVLPNGKYYMTMYPETTMGTTTHTTLVVLGCIGCFLYVIGIPAVVGHIIYSARSQDRLANVSFLRRFGFLYRRYESKYFYWEIVLLARRLALTAVLVFLQDHGIAQAACGSIIIAVCIAGQYYSQPFRDSDVDLLDSICCMVNLFYITTGIVQTHASAVYRDVFGVITLFLFALVLAFALYLLLKEIGEKVVMARSYKMINDRITHMMLEEPIPEPGESKENAKIRVRRILGASDLAFRVLDKDNNQEVTWVEMASRFHLISGKSSDRLTEDEAQNLVELMDDTGSGAVNFLEFLAHVARELLARNTPVGTGTGIRRVMRSRGLRESLVMDAILAFVHRTEGVKPVFPTKEIDPNEKPEHISRRNLDRVFGSDLYTKSKRPEDFEEGHLNMDKIIERAKKNGYQARHEWNARVAAANVLQELPFTLDPLGLHAWLEAGTTPEQIMCLLRLEVFLQDSVSDTAELSEYRHTPRAETYRKFVHQFPFMVGYVVDPSLPESDVASLRLMVEKASKLFKNTGEWTQDTSEAVSSLDYASIFHFCLTPDNNHNRVEFGELLEGLAAARKHRVSTNPLVRVAAAFFPSISLMGKAATTKYPSSDVEKQSTIAAPSSPRREGSAEGASPRSHPATYSPSSSMQSPPRLSPIASKSAKSMQTAASLFGLNTDELEMETFAVDDDGDEFKSSASRYFRQRPFIGSKFGRNMSRINSMR